MNLNLTRSYLQRIFGLKIPILNSKKTRYNQAVLYLKERPFVGGYKIWNDKISINLDGDGQIFQNRKLIATIVKPNKPEQNEIGNIFLRLSTHDKLEFVGYATKGKFWWFPETEFSLFYGNKKIGLTRMQNKLSGLGAEMDFTIYIDEYYLYHIIASVFYTYNDAPFTVS